MDATDFKIVKILQNKARIPNVEVARQIGMAPSAVLERIKKLEARGIIDGYEVRLNPERFNRSMIAFVEVRVRDAASIRETGRKLADLEAVQEVHFLAGNDSLLVKLRVSDTNELESLLMTEISAIQTILSTKTEIALATFKETARIPIT
ncbi:MAG: Lrp/AsnC family transcriptional regulator [Desulfobacteraceae bacterium]|nr:Lrp/AsnC family transcriptional regulator [Desulfobacteraceae bacterium]